MPGPDHLSDSCNLDPRSNSRNAGTFLLGVGAQKAGTSWLHQQLNQRNDAHFGFLKEYHIHDALHVDGFANYGRGRRWAFGPRSLRRRWLMGDPARYYNYFHTILQRPGIALTGDITPPMPPCPPARCTAFASSLNSVASGFALCF